MNPALTTRQRDTLDLIERALASGQPPPTHREIATHFGFKSPKAATDLVKALELKGFLKHSPKQARGLRLAQATTGVPLVGRIAAGFATDATLEPTERLEIDPVAFGIRRDRAFALRVTGDSMTGRQIFHGDVVLLEREAEPRHLDIVAALIDCESTLKTLVLSGGKSWLRAENPLYPDLLPLADLQIQGVARGVIRWIKR